jgi:lipid-binding SYLF domain-containing protein
MARTPDGKDWNGPVFQLLSGVVLDHQPGRWPSTIFLLAMTDRGVSALLSDDARLRHECGAAGENPDILGFLLSEGVGSRLSLDGAVVTTCHGLNRAAHGRDVTPADIIRGAVRSASSAELAHALIRAAGQATSGASRGDRSSADSRGRATRWARMGAALPSTGGGRIG